MHRRFLLKSGLALAGLAPSVLAYAQPAPADLLGATGEPYFIAWLNAFYARAAAAGLPRTLLDHELSGLSSDPRITALDARQPEFARPVSAYIAGVVSDARVAVGRGKRTAVSQFASIEKTYGVPRDILIAVWAMESNFGVLQGDFDIIRSLATLAAAGRRRDWAEGELVSALKIIADGAAPRSKLRGSWAGAMGQTQLLPSTYLSSAADGDGDGRREIWGSAPDALSSAANLLAKGGWRRGEGWAYEVVLPSGFDYGLSENAKEVPGWWRAKGVHKADATAWSPADSLAPAMLLLPSGAKGPAFLALPNHFAIRAYALGVGLLADRFAGGGPLRTAWPAESPLSLTDRLDAQTALAKLGFNPGPADGAIGLLTRQALRAWQKSQNLPADGYLSPEIVARLRKAV